VVQHHADYGNGAQRLYGGDNVPVFLQRSNLPTSFRGPTLSLDRLILTDARVGKNPEGLAEFGPAACFAKAPAFPMIEIHCLGEGRSIWSRFCALKNFRNGSVQSSHGPTYRNDYSDTTLLLLFLGHLAEILSTYRNALKDVGGHLSMCCVSVASLGRKSVSFCRGWMPRIALAQS